MQQLFTEETTPEGDFTSACWRPTMYNQSKAYVPSGQMGNCSEGSRQNIKIIRLQIYY
jgi:hypothetical protein